MKKEPVFCNDCRWRLYEELFGEAGEQCGHASHTYATPDTRRPGLRRDWNAHNDCKEFEPQGEGQVCVTSRPWCNFAGTVPKIEVEA
jgi:hypothetical protein